MRVWRCFYRDTYPTSMDMERIESEGWQIISIVPLFRHGNTVQVVIYAKKTTDDEGERQA